MVTREFPRDVLIEILSRLPVKSLLCYRSVSKYWNSLIQNPGLIKLHQDHSQSTKENALFALRSIRLSFSTIGNDWFKTVCTPFLPDTLTPMTDIDYYESPSVTYPKGKTYTSIELYGPCNGIICIKDHEFCHEDYFVLCNPATRELKTLPDPPFSYPEGMEARNILIGFGFDAIANDYKLVRAIRPGRCDEFTDFHYRPWKVEIYSLHDDAWTEAADVELPFSSAFAAHSDITYANACHWIGYETTYEEAESERFMYILVFDMVEEAFQKIQVTEEEDFFKELDNFGQIMFIVYDGSLALIKYELHIVECYFRLWVMREYGVVESWQRILIGPLDGVYRPLASRNADELFLENGDGELVSCDPATEAINPIGLSGMQYTFAVIIYRECLTSIKGCSANE